jgi:hypothetical protein
MALPFSRNTTYASMSQVQSADLNDIQDVDIANIGDLILALGGSAGAPYTTLVQLFDQSTFTPEFVGSVLDKPDPGDIAEATGVVFRVGAWAHVVVRMRWTNSEAAAVADPVKILPPFDPDLTNIDEFSGPVSTRRSDFGAETPTFPAEAVIGAFASSPATIRVFGANGDALDYGGSGGADEITVQFHVSYPHTGEGLYPGLPGYVAP